MFDDGAIKPDTPRRAARCGRLADEIDTRGRQVELAVVAPQPVAVERPVDRLARRIGIGPAQRRAVERAIGLAHRSGIEIKPRLRKAQAGHEHPGLGHRRLLAARHAQRRALALRRQRRPANGFIAFPPGHPRRGPTVARHPEPAACLVITPPAIVIDRPAERLVGGPQPAIAVRPQPLAQRVGAPARRNAGRHPDIAIRRHGHPAAMRGERRIEYVDIVRRGLGGCGVEKIAVEALAGLIERHGEGEGGCHQHRRQAAACEARAKRPPRPGRAGRFGLSGRRAAICARQGVSLIGGHCCRAGDPGCGDQHSTLWLNGR